MDDIVAKTIKFREENEKLKAQLQRSIDSGLGKFNANKNDDIVAQEKSNQIQIIKSCDAQYSKHANKTISNSSRPTFKPTSLCGKNCTDQEDKSNKIKSYNVEEARAYIKKQRVKRMEQLKESSSEKITEEERKKKLQELHKRSLELVTRNVQLSRLRSKSRERKDYVRPDNQIQSRPAVRQRDQCNQNGGVSFLNINTVKGKQQFFPVQLTSNVTVRRGPSKLKNTLHEFNNLSPPKEASSRNLCITENHKDSNICSKLEKYNGGIINNDINSVCVNSLEKEGNPLNTNESLNDCVENGNHCEGSSSSKNIGRKINLISNVIIRSPTSANHHYPPLVEDNMGHYKFSITEEPKKATEKDDAKDEFLKRSPADEGKQEFPEWLEEIPAEVYPFNFINTVKRDLQFANSSKRKSTIDVGIQSSFEENLPLRKTEPPTDNLKSNGFQYVPVPNELSNFRSFVSHKNINLDSKPIERLELIPKVKCNSDKLVDLMVHKDIGTKSITKLTESDSESDTSKNIPEISSESGTSLKRNAISVRRNLSAELKLAFDTDRIDALKLVPQIKSTTTTIRSEFSPKIEVESHSNRISSVQKKSVSPLKSSSSSSVSITEIKSKSINNIPSKNESVDPLSAPKPMSVKTHHDLLEDTNINVKLRSNSIHSKASSKLTVPETNFIKTNTYLSKNKSSKSTIGRTSSRNKSSSTKLTHSMNNFLNADTKYSVQEDEIEYTSDFDSRSCLTPSSCLSRSRESILAFNSPEYNEQVIGSPVLIQEDSTELSVVTERVSANFTNKTENCDVLPLKEPSASLKNNILSISENDHKNVEKKNLYLKNVTLTSRGKDEKHTDNVNEIHLKFEAEIRLLNDFNESLRKFSAVEKAFESLKTTNDLNVSNVLQNQNTQTSVISKSSTVTKTTEKTPDSLAKKKSELSNINYSRGSNISEDSDSLGMSIFTNPLTNQESSEMDGSGTELSNLRSTRNVSIVKSEQNLIDFENLQANHFAGFSLNMFEQLIKDEDARLENLKAILKIREKVLLDRTRGELGWLEIQKKQLKETGKLHEAVAIKKKQRAVLLNHQKEQHEMQRLKQMQRAASAERKIILKQQRNLIRKQLSTDNMLGKMKISIPRERRHSGPLKVIQTRTECVLSETSISRKSSSDQEKEVYSITSHHSMSRISDISEIATTPSKVDQMKPAASNSKRQEHIKKTLLMREAALRKRRKAAEELLQWHKQLLEEEKRINKLELKASSIIPQRLSSAEFDRTEKYKFEGKQLNQLWYTLTGCEEKKFIQDNIYPMSQIALERFCKSARQYSTKTKKLLKKSSSSKSDLGDVSVELNIPKSTISQFGVNEIPKQMLDQKSVTTVSENEYASDFEVESLAELVDENIDVSENISELITDFSRIKDDISALSINQSRIDTERASQSPKSARSDSEAEISVIETNRNSKNDENSHIAMVSKMVNSERHVDTQVNSSQRSLHDIKEISFETEQLNEDTDMSPNSNISSEHLTRSIIPNNRHNETDLIKFTDTDGESKFDISKITTETHDNLNKSKEILVILGEEEEMVSLKDVSSRKTVSSQTDKGKENVNTSEDILLSLAQAGVDIATDHSVLDNVEHSLGKSFSQSEVIEGVEEKICIMKITDLEEAGENSPTKTENELPSIVIDEETSEEEQPVVTDSDQLSNRKSYAGEDSERRVTLSEISLQETDEDDNIASEDNHKNSKAPSDENVCEETTNKTYKLINLPEEGDEDVEKNEHNLENISESSGAQKVAVENFVSADGDSTGTIDTIDRHFSASVEDFSASCEPVSEQEKARIEYFATTDKVGVTNTIIQTDEHLSVAVDKDYTKTDETTDSASTENQLLNDNVHNSEREVLSGAVNVDTDSAKSEIVDSKTEFSNSEPRSSFKEGSVDNVVETKIRDKNSSTSASQSSLGEERSSVLTEPTKTNVSEDKTPLKEVIDVKKRVHEIMADANPVMRGDKSPRLQDLYVTTYDLVSPANSPESGSPIDEKKLIAASIFGHEAEEILKKQLAIEQEIKQITEQQQKERQIPFLYVREIPNKPPPPYTPPSPQRSTVHALTVIPKAAEIEEISKYSSKILYKAYLTKNLDNISISENTLSLISKNIPKERYKFVFDLCKDISRQHYKQFEVEKVPCWLQLPKKPHLNVAKPLDANGLEKHINLKLKEAFGYEKPNRRENAIIKWSRKKRDHVDEILVMECQAEEAQWTNYENDELLIMDQVTNEILNSLLKETGEIFNKILAKRT